MAEWADLGDPPARLSATEVRTWHVSTLQAVAEASQRQIRAELSARHKQGGVVDYKSFWICNALAVTADSDTLLALAARPDVRFIRQDRWRPWIEPASEPSRLSSSAESDTSWNLDRIRADLAWSALRLNGSGVTVGIVDSGVDWQHPALQAQYRGYKPGGLVVHQGNWACTTDEGSLYPVDGNGHGTHVAGTIVGSSDIGGQAIGVAPGARWIAVKAISDQGYAYDSWLHAAFEWLMAPAGDPALAPDVVNGSWGSWDSQDETFRRDLEVMRGAGIVPVFAAGNEGPALSSVRSPASYPETIAVGATDDLDRVTSFSSRGPSPWGEIKPELVAPGAQIRSSLPGGTYGAKSGTSMAAPHVTGVVALMLQADPSLTVDEVEAILTSTAQPLGGEVPDNHAGWGRVDAYRAASTTLRAGILTGQVTRHPDLQPLPTAQIAVVDEVGQPWAAVRADETGRYQIALPGGRYSLTGQAFGYASQTVPGIVVQSALTTTVDLSLSPLPGGVLWGQVSDAETGGPVGAEITVLDTPALTRSDPQTGQYSLVLPAGTYAVQVSQNGYRRWMVQNVEILADEATRLDAALAPAPTLLLVDSGPWYYDSHVDQFKQALEDKDYVYDLWPIRDLAVDLPAATDLASYEITIWSSPRDAPGLIGAGGVISEYLSIEGNLLLTGQDVGYWDDGLNGSYWHPYYRRWLQAQTVADDAGRGDIVGVAGEILGDLVLSINGADSDANQVAPDVVTIHGPHDAAIVGQYRDDGAAFLRASGCQSYRAVYLAAGLEGLGDRAGRAEVLDRALSWLGAPHAATDLTLRPLHQDQIWLEARTLTYTVELQNTGGATDRFALELGASSWPATVWDGTFSQMLTHSMDLSPCATQTLGVKVTVPPGVTWHVSDTVMLTARSLTDPSRIAQATFSSKAPEPILLVEDQRWYDYTERYRDALQANHLPYDLWSTHQPPLSDVAPGSDRLARYPLVLWFTGYDWYRTLTAEDEAQLAAYLDDGGRLLLTSQDYLYTGGSSGFAQDYLGVVGYTEGLSVTQVVGAVGSPVAQGIDPTDLYYPFRNWSDSLRFSPVARPALWGQHGQPAALTLDRAPWKTAFFAFPLETLLPGDLARLLGQAVGWLSPLGDSTIVAEQATASAGEQVAYTLEIRNTERRPLDSVYLSNTVPISASYVAGSLTGPASYDPATRQFSWAGPLAAGQTVMVRYRLWMDPSLPAGSTVRNVMHLSDESGLNLERVALSRIGTADLSSSTKAVSADRSVAGAVLTYTITLSNDGLAEAQAELVDPWPPYTLPLPGSAWASDGQIIATEQALEWRGSILPGERTILGVAVLPLPTSVSLYVHNRARLHDSWGQTTPLEASTWIESRIFLPLILR